MLKPTKVLTDKQLTFLGAFSSFSLSSRFYLTGGTALCGFYLPYRYSEDLDFFSFEEIDIETITVFIKSKQETLGFKTFDIQTSFNRNLIFLEFGNETLKTEFTYFPFPQKGTPKEYKDVPIDSLEDIALNKLFTIYQNPRLRDFMDLYKILQQEKYNFDKLILGSKAKFDWHIDKLQLGSQLLKARERKDVPRLVDDFKFSKMEDFYQGLAKELGATIIEE